VFVAAEHLVALGVRRAVWSLPLVLLSRALSGFRPPRLVFVGGCGWRLWLVFVFWRFGLCPPCFYFFVLVVLPLLLCFSSSWWLGLAMVLLVVAVGACDREDED
jgi:hypothetical protein